VHFFDISTFNSGPSMVCFVRFVRFVRFDFELSFAPQQHAIFHLSSGQLRGVAFSMISKDAFSVAGAVQKTCS